MANSDMKLLRKPSFVMEMKQQPLMLLKDFLTRDDFSSCSSNGFKSFPRRQCCTATTVRYLLDRDLNNRARNTTNSSSSKQRLLKRSRSSKAAAISALQRASVVVLNAVKHLPFVSVKSRPSPPPSSSSSVQNYTRKGLLLPRSFSRKLLKRSFWKKTENNGGREIQRLRSFSEFLEEKEQPSDSITVTTNTTAITTTTTTTTTTSTSNSNSWSGSEFTSDYLQCSSSNSESFGENDAVGGKTNSPEKKKKDNKRVGGDSMEEEEAASTITYCIEPNVVKKGWPTEEEKEQFSPVSVLDCPFDDEEEICSPFRHRLARMEGKKQKLMQNIRRFESLAQLEPMDLEKRMALSEADDSESLESPNQFTLTSTMAMDTATFEKIEKEIKTEQKAEELLNIIKTKSPSDSTSKYKSDKLFLDFFRDRIEGRFVKPSGGDEQLLKVAEDWVSGKPHEVLLDWQVQDGRKAYIRDMEEEGEWRIEGEEKEEKEEVGLEVEVEVWTCLVDELVFDVFFR